MRRSGAWPVPGSAKDTKRCVCGRRGRAEGGGVSSAVSSSGCKIRAGTAGVKAYPGLLQGGIGWGGQDTGQQGVAVLMMWIQLRR